MFYAFCHNWSIVLCETKSKLFPARIPNYQAIFRKVWILYKFRFVEKSKLLDFSTMRFYVVFWFHVLFQILVKTIAYAPNCLYVNWFTWIIFYFFSYIADMAHYNIIITIIWFVPDNIIYLFFAENSSGIACQQTQNFKFNKC